MTAAQIEAALNAAPAHERITLAAQLIANALLADELADSGAAVPADRDALIAHLESKLAR